MGRRSLPNGAQSGPDTLLWPELFEEMEAEHLLPPLERTPALPQPELDGAGDEAGVPGAIPELQVLNQPKLPGSDEMLPPDDGGWSTIAGRPPPSNEAGTTSGPNAHT